MHYNTIIEYVQNNAVQSMDLKHYFAVWITFTAEIAAVISSRWFDADFVGATAYLVSNILPL